MIIGIDSKDEKRLEFNQTTAFIVEGFNLSATL